MAQVLAAGQWRSQAFMNYLDQNEVDETAIFDCIEQVSDDEATSAGSSPMQGTEQPVQTTDVARIGEFLAIEDIPRPPVRVGPSDVSKLQEWEREVLRSSRAELDRSRGSLLPSPRGAGGESVGVKRGYQQSDLASFFASNPKRK